MGRGPRADVFHPVEPSAGRLLAQATIEVRDYNQRIVKTAVFEAGEKKFGWSLFSLIVIYIYS